MTKCYATSDLIVRLLVSRNDPEINQLLQWIKEHKITLFIPVMVILDAYDVLVNEHGLPKEKVAHALEHLTESDDVQIEDKDDIHYALHHSQSLKREPKAIYHRQKAKDKGMVITEPPFMDILNRIGE